MTRSRRSTRGIIYCQVKGFASGSPHEKGLAFDMIAQAAGGPISVTGWPDQPPVKPGLSFGDTGTGMLMAATILGALHERNRTGVGRRLEVAMQDAMVHYMRTCFATMARTGKPAQRRGAKPSAGNNAPAGLFPCKGGGPNDYLYITTSRANPEHYSRLMKLIGREELIEDPRFATGDARVKNSVELENIIGEWTSQHDKREVMEKLIAVGVPAGAVFDTMELQNEPSFVERGFMQTVKHHNGEYKMASWPVRVDGKSVKIKGSPALGQDTADVLQSWLKIDARRPRGAKERGRAQRLGVRRAAVLVDLQVGEGGAQQRRRQPEPDRAAAHVADDPVGLGARTVREVVVHRGVVGAARLGQHLRLICSR